jgi:adenylate cyclase
MYNVPIHGSETTTGTMPDTDIARRLTTIMAADVVGYSRQMSLDEVDTMRRLRKLRREAIDPVISKYDGRIFKTMGDGLLIEFGSTVNAVECAAELQMTLETRNAGLAEGKEMQLRIGLNIGDVIIDGDDIYGHGVNVAARIEGVADPGGVSLSGVVHDQVVGKVGFKFSEASEPTLKNIDTPVVVYQLDMASVRETQPKEPGQSDALLALPDKPSIAVLACENMSDDPGQEHFSDGIAEDLITALSRFRSLFVIAL